ncbi:hypothetical protein [Methylococcus sp. EFPC2]|uniref:hypothetical protein n=1 Tax=Methylococcus sp. EFPC2 TaxID=2812648 RepID=UPI001967FC29|nr:hypothetical protein [Methylococcus sp. EFPC2]QSA97053.1 hypothetical protein JWZ97_17930 [Methylococcus sp. EFPC2]
MKMKYIAGVMAILAVIYFLPAYMRMHNANELSGGSTEQLKKSAMQVRRTMPTNDRTVFDMAFGILEKLKSEEGPDAFTQAVDGLKPDELIALARQEVNVKIAAGHPEFKQYASWDDMVEKLTAPPKKPGQQATPLRQSERAPRPN